ncbi:cytochrome P450 4V2-like [Centruroides sculpturatus]|uniref:cytochrome P450 4V2-like n=1 Tax=Centruroides sculpturatus TaxID=218467 RepID=UPI000C6DE3ED|nr:cytochrome P450 4V2-like [Centruroides sculpturatus]
MARPCGKTDRSIIVDTDSFGNGHLQLLSSWAEVYRKIGFFRTYIGIYPVVIIYKAEILETILSSNVNIYKDKGYRFLNVWLKDGLFTSSGSKWRARRKLLTPSFHFKILEDFFPIFNDHCSVMLDIMNNCVDHDWVDIVPIITRCNLDIICETAMGVKLNSQICQDRGYRSNLESLVQNLNKFSKITNGTDSFLSGKMI